MSLDMRLLFQAFKRATIPFGSANDSAQPSEGSLSDRSVEWSTLLATIHHCADDREANRSIRQTSC